MGIPDQFNFLAKCLPQNCRELPRIHATVKQTEKDKTEGYCFKAGQCYSHFEFDIFITYSSVRTFPPELCPS